jgi:hypothetical protein
MLLVAGGQDLIAQWLNVSILSVTYVLDALIFIVPLAAALFTWRLCRDLQQIRPRPGHVDPFADDSTPEIIHTVDVVEVVDP